MNTLHSFFVFGGVLKTVRSVRAGQGEPSPSEGDIRAQTYCIFTDGLNTRANGSGSVLLWPAGSSVLACLSGPR